MRIRAATAATALIVGAVGLTGAAGATAAPASAAAVAPTAVAAAQAGGRITISVGGERLGRKATITLSGIKGRAKKVKKTVKAKRSTTLRRLAPGTYRLTAQPIRKGSRTANAAPRQTNVKVSRKRGGTVRFQYSTCSQATVRFSATMVPSCGILSGAVANAFGNRPGWPAQGPDSHTRFEQAVGTTFGLYTYYFPGSTGPQFPRAGDIALLRQPGSNRAMLAHWKVADDMTFADVVAGRADERIDRQAAYLKANFPERIFVAIQSEMEIQVDPRPGSGRTAADYARMYRYVVDRMRARGADNVIWVLAYGGYSRWATKPWFADLYPGDSYVDWIGWHPYGTTRPDGPAFDDLLNETEAAENPSYRGMYDYLTRVHRGKPLMLSEFGVFHDPRDGSAKLARKAAFYDGTVAQLYRFPAIKAIINFDTDYDANKDNGFDISVFSNSQNLAAFREFARLPLLVDPVPQSGPVR